MPNPQTFSIVIQAGGESRRMGQDKGLVLFRGEPLVQRVARRMADIAGEVLITTNRPDQYAFLNLPAFPDLIPNRGALGGLYTALARARGPIVGVVACDMPFASPALLSAERDRLLQDPALAAAIPSNGVGAEPFHAAYRKALCLPAIEAALEAGKWRADSWWEQAPVLRLSPEEVLRSDPQRIAFWNVNTPDELSQAESSEHE